MTRHVTRRVDKWLLLCSFAACAFITMAVAPAMAEDSTYVGTEACAECHEDQHANFKKFAKKAHSAESVKRMAPKLTAEELKDCYHCHTTGYGSPSGFKSFKETPHLADAGCEVCHGPGGQHVEEGGDTDYIKLPELDDCTVCHNQERVASFDFKPLLHGGAH